jgi:hypothetical protein
MSSDSSTIRFQAFCVPKQGYSAAEYEDASAANVALGRFAIADGATESAFAALWARLLVDEFVAAEVPDPSTWANWLPALQTRWEIEVGQQPLPWYGEIQWQQGAFATFLGVIVQPPRWQVLAVGDSCLFHVRDGHLRNAFPLVHAADFSDSPWLVGSRGFSPVMMALREGRTEGELGPGDRLWLMTDALAKWFLQMVEAGKQPWEMLEPFLQSPATHEQFCTWIAALRDGRQLRNDDVTMLAVWCETKPGEART